MATEYRWLKIGLNEAGGHRAAITPFPFSPYGLVLQVRHEEGPRGESWWGEWEDVEVVTADRDGAVQEPK